MKQVTLKKSAMNKQSGFTLIELVIVIIILGILSATAIPKFIDLQGDAKTSAMQGVKGALEAAASLTYSRAAIDGDEDNAGPVDVDGVSSIYGYPDTTSSALSTAAGLDANDWDIVGTSGGSVAATINASGETDTDCQVTYKLNSSSARPTITANVTGC